MRKVDIVYTNWRGETATRYIEPRSLWYGKTEWHPEPQWLLKAVDFGKKAERDFALKDIESWTPVSIEEELDRMMKEPIPPEMLELAQKALDRQAEYDAWYETLSDEEKAREDARQQAAIVDFIMNGPGGD